MSVEQEEEIKKLLWSYTEVIPVDEEKARIEKIRSFFKSNKLPISHLQTMFLEVDQKTHLNAVNIAVKVACEDIIKLRPRMN